MEMWETTQLISMNEDVANEVSLSKATMAALVATTWEAICPSYTKTLQLKV